MAEKSEINQILSKFENDKTRLMDILLTINEMQGFISRKDMQNIAASLGISTTQVQETATFYHFFSSKPRGKYTIYLDNSITAVMKGRAEVKEAFERHCETTFGKVSAEGLFGLFDTSCIGMNDQEPAAIINGKIFTNLTPYRVKHLAEDMRAGKSPDEMMYEDFGNGNNAHPDVKAMVNNHIRKKSIILENDYEPFHFLTTKLKEHTPETVISEIEASNLRGRGGAGFPTGLKWRFGRRTDGKHRIIICNADEGEPGTFKDRVLLTEYSDLVFEGMVIAAFATGSDLGLLYLRYEYKYLLRFLNHKLEEMRKNHFLGQNIAGVEGFDFNIRIQLGAGAYICGEESALIESLEGKRGEPRDKPPFPVEKGYLGYPTIVNNVETLATAVKIMHNGAAWYSGFGTKDSLGTKLLSISGDCRFPGIYEVEWGTTIREILAMSSAKDVQAIQVGGPSGMMIGLKDAGNMDNSELMKWYKPSGMMVAQKIYDRKLSYSDLPTGGSMILFNNDRNLLRDVVMNFMDFFIEESCGSCSTCRNLPFVMKQKLEKILNGHGVRQDIDDLLSWGKIIKVSRCGLGQTAANPILSSILNFRGLYEKDVKAMTDFDNVFDIEKSVEVANKYVGRKMEIHHN